MKLKSNQNTRPPLKPTAASIPRSTLLLTLKNTRLRSASLLFESIVLSWSGFEPASAKNLPQSTPKRTTCLVRASPSAHSVVTSTSGFPLMIAFTSFESPRPTRNLRVTPKSANSISIKVPKVRLFPTKESGEQPSLRTCSSPELWVQQSGRQEQGDSPSDEWAEWRPIVLDECDIEYFTLIYSATAVFDYEYDLGTVITVLGSESRDEDAFIGSLKTKTIIFSWRTIIPWTPLRERQEGRDATLRRTSMSAQTFL